MADAFIRPQPKRNRTQQQVVQIAISAGAVDTAVVVPPPSPPGSLTQDVLGAGDGAGGNTTDVLQVNDANDKIEAGS